VRVLFLIISALGLWMALGTVLARNLVHAALYLVGFFFIIACQFVLLEAEFLAAIQVLVYIGTIAILMMFGIMLTRNVQGDDTAVRTPAAALPASLAGIALFLVLGFGIHHHSRHAERPAWYEIQWREPARVSESVPTSARTLAINNMGKAVGIELMNRYAIAFEVAGLLLTVALVGAIALAYRAGDDEPLRLRERAAAMPVVGSGSGNGHPEQSGTATEALSSPTR
jgi:NADH-quinone oxidoreductase subunit J